MRSTPDRADAAPWLYGIASNLVAKHRRGVARRARAFARLGRDQPGDEAERVVAMIDADRRWPEVAALVATLPSGERDVVLLYAWERLSYEQIAAALSVPVGTVRSRLNRARRRLREPTVASGEGPMTTPRGDTVAVSRRMAR